MRNFCWLFIFFFSFAALFAEELPFSINVPDGWVAGGELGQGVQVFTYSRADEKARIIVYAFEGISKVSVAKTFKSFTAQVFPEFTLKSTRNGTFNGLPVMMGEFSTIFAGKDVQARLYLGSSPVRTFAVVSMSLKELPEVEQNIIQVILDTIRFPGVSGATGFVPQEEAAPAVPNLTGSWQRQDGTIYSFDNSGTAKITRLGKETEKLHFLAGETKIKNLKYLGENKFSGSEIFGWKNRSKSPVYYPCEYLFDNNQLTMSYQGKIYYKLIKK